MNSSAPSSLPSAIEVRTEGDLIVVRVTGRITLGDFEQLGALNAKLKAQYGIFFALYDARKMDGIESDARKALTSSPDLTAARPTVTAIFGASYTIQTMGNMIDRAMKALGRQTEGRVFFADEQQARAYIQKERARLKNR